jgi:two-component system, NtrC family, nitrogen regulation sensor histidine kinase NtrY
VNSLLQGKYVWFWVSVGLILLAMVFRYFFVIQQNTSEINAQKVTSRLVEAIEDNKAEMEYLQNVLNETQSPTFAQLYKITKHPYYIFSNRRIIFWSKSDFTPNYGDVLGEFEISFLDTERGKYVAQKVTTTANQRNYEIVFLIPLIEEFSIVNEYLNKDYNKEIFTDGNFEIIPQTNDQAFQSIQIEGVNLFAINFGNTYANSLTHQRLILIMLLTLAFVAFFLFVKRVLAHFVYEGEVFQGFLFLFCTVIAVRSLMLLTGFPFDFVFMEIFNPRHYASSIVNPSLGDLLLNLVALMLVGLYVFNNFLQAKVVREMLKSMRSRKVLISIACIFFSFFWLAVHHQTMRSLNIDSQWSMDITRTLEFDYLKLMGYGLYFISVIIYFLFTHVCFRLFHQLNPTTNRYFYYSFLLGLLLFIGLAILFRWDFEVVVIVNMIFFIVVRFFNLHRYVGRLQFLTFIYFFSFGLPGALIGVYANYQFTKSNIAYDKSRLATQLLIERNFFTEMQLADVAGMIKDDSFIKKRIFSPFASKLIIEKKIRREYLTNLQQFDVQISVFNSKGDPFEQFNIKQNYHTIKSQNHTFGTDTEGLYFVNPVPGQSTTQYLNFIEIEDRDQIIGYILLDLRQKRLVPNSVFPLLINEGLYNRQIDNPEQFSYSVFVDKEIQYSSGTFNYRQYMSDLADRADDLFNRGIIFRDYEHRAFLGENGRFVIISSKVPSVNLRIANFSFLFLIFIFSILMILIGVAIYQSARHIKLNYAAKIQLYLNFAFFTPLIIVSITTISVIVQSFKTSLEGQYLEYGENLSGLISEPLHSLRTLAIESEDLSDRIYEMAEVADVDMNVYFTTGRLIASSLIQVYQNNILSYNIEPEAYIRILENQETSCVLEEKVGLLKYKNVYVGVRSTETGTIIGILSLPFFASQKDLEQRIIDVLSYIINIFTFLFVIFLFVSFFVSRGLTFPLWLITQKIKRTTLSSFNEPLSWNSDDEIGMMVTEYNRMLVNLEESKKALAKSEKESAWREMARQVAHEIKNPLTPMKLTLQHMKRIIDDAGDNGETEKKQKQINTLLEQIETLSDIATSFSNFAKMPAPKSELLDIRLLLLETIELYDKKELGKIVTNIEEGQFMIEGDRKWLGRAFSNLIINGFQAVSDHRKAILAINLKSMERKRVRIEIQDNGEGIPDHIGEKVFTPNFSTKYSGSGLGLAITRKGIEHANGKIWFNSTEGAGTTFYVEIPLI